MANQIIRREDAPDAEALKTALALVYDAPEDAEAIAAVAGVSPTDILTILATEAGVQAAMVRLEELRQSGELLRRKALAPLEKLIDQIEALIDAGAISASAAPKLAEVLFKLSGLAEERAARLRVQAPERQLPIIYIRHGDDPVPEHPGRDAIVIRLPHRLEPETPIKDVNVIDAEEVRRD